MFKSFPDKIKVNISIDGSVWKEFQAVAAKYGVTASYMAQLIMAAVIQGEQKGIRSITKNMMVGMVKGAKDLSKKDKAELLKALTD